MLIHVICVQNEPYEPSLHLTNAFFTTGLKLFVDVWLNYVAFFQILLMRTIISMK